VSILNIDLNVILNIPAGPEMDALVAKEVIGDTVDFEEDHQSQPSGQRVWYVLKKNERSPRVAVPKFSTDIEAAWGVAEKMQAHGEELSLQYGNMVEGAPGTAAWTARFRMANEFATAVTPSLAICRAALLATRSKKHPSNKVDPGVFFSTLETELAKVMGPIASIIVDDKVAELGGSRESFPKDRTGALVRAIADEIADGDERASFVETMAGFFQRRRT
jgi:hypothetical protein